MVLWVITTIRSIHSIIFTIRKRCSWQKGTVKGRSLVPFKLLNPCLVGGFNPSEKYESQLRWLFPIYGKIKNVPNHQPDVPMSVRGYHVTISWWFVDETCCGTCFFSTHQIQRRRIHHDIPGLVNSPKKRTGKIHHVQWVNPLFRLGHGFNSYFDITRGYG